MEVGGPRKEERWEGDGGGCDGDGERERERDGIDRE
jgi:hypothetical protein